MEKKERTPSITNPIAAISAIIEIHPSKSNDVFFGLYSSSLPSRDAHIASSKLEISCITVVSAEKYFPPSDSVSIFRFVTLSETF
jgi:hypothetical protein